MESIFKIKIELMNVICRSENMKKKNTSEKI
ncbi:TPA: hypothetical protein O2D43_001558 [Staphylococcus aureus]|nr:hypothetical protein [Staphylococcus aureus]